MRKWNRTTMAWKYGIAVDTDMEVDDVGVKREKWFHKIHSITITSLPKPGTALVELLIRRCASAPTTKKDEIFRRLRELSVPRFPCQFVDQQEGFRDIFQVFYVIPGKKQFCNWAIEWATSCLKQFGVEDNELHHVSGFEITQQTFVFHEDEWVDFAWWLRQEKYHLPQSREPEKVDYVSLLV